MARNSRNRSRARRRGNLYARPIPEPANFIEFDVTLDNETGAISHADIASAITGIIPVTGIAKYRVSSLVFEPVASPVSVPGGAEVTLGISGNEYLFPMSNKPLRIKLGKDYGDDGMWIVLDQAALTDAALPGNEATGDSFFELHMPSIVTSWSTQVHVRVAWTDPT